MYNKIIELCKKNNITKAKLCRDTGLSISGLSELKHGRTKQLSMSNTQKIAMYFGVTTDYLLGIEQEKKPLINEDEELAKYLKELENRDELRMLFNLMSNASKKEVELAIKIVETILEGK